PVRSSATLGVRPQRGGAPGAGRVVTGPAAPREPLPGRAAVQRPRLRPRPARSQALSRCLAARGGPPGWALGAALLLQPGQPGRAGGRNLPAGPVARGPDRSVAARL